MLEVFKGHEFQDYEIDSSWTRDLTPFPTAPHDTCTTHCYCLLNRYRKLHKKKHEETAEVVKLNKRHYLSPLILPLTWWVARVSKELHSWRRRSAHLSSFSSGTPAPEYQPNQMYVCMRSSKDIRDASLAVNGTKCLYGKKVARVSSVMRRRTSSIDMVLFLSGLPVNGTKRPYGEK